VKISVTYEISKENRLVLGLLQANELRPATREEMESYLREAAFRPLEAATNEYRKSLKEMMKGVKVKLEEAAGDPTIDKPTTKPTPLPE
jgi:hypothetical protein